MRWLPFQFSTIAKPNKSFTLPINKISFKWKKTERPCASSGSGIGLIKNERLSWYQYTTILSRYLIFFWRLLFHFCRCWVTERLLLGMERRNKIICIYIMKIQGFLLKLLGFKIYWSNNEIFYWETLVSVPNLAKDILRLSKSRLASDLFLKMVWTNRCGLLLNFTSKYYLHTTTITFTNLI